VSLAQLCKRQHHRYQVAAQQCLQTQEHALHKHALHEHLLWL